MDDPATLAEVKAAFAAYETALMTNDVEALDALFWNAPQTVRYGPGENLYGHDEIAAFRKARAGGSPQRRLTRTVITTFGADFATANTEFLREDSARVGRQSQTWVRTEGGWRIVAAHVSITAGAGRMNREGFIAAYGHLFEHSPWVIERAWDLRPFADAEALHAAFMQVLSKASPEERLTLVRAHPQLADKAAIAQGLTDSSAAEQAGAGLTRLNEHEFEVFHALNRAYLERHGFPFVICVRLHDKAGILSALRERLTHSAETELAEAIAQIGLISRMRLDLIPAEVAP